MTIFPWLEKQWRYPTFSSLIKHRKVVLFLLVIIVIHLFSTGIGFGLWPCPIKTTLGFKCPGCGLSQAIVHLLHGRYDLAIKEHLFAPLFVLGFFMMAGMALLPVQLYQKVTLRIELLEKKTGFFNIMMAALVVYWIVRMFVKAW
jgi:hypothetical protein